jgi:hypothetical protein
MLAAVINSPSTWRTLHGAGVFTGWMLALDPDPVMPNTAGRGRRPIRM